MGRSRLCRRYDIQHARHLAKETITISAVAYDEQIAYQWNRVTPQINFPQSGAVEYGLAVPEKWVLPALQAVVQLAHLQPNWDGYGSPPLSLLAIRAARRLVKTLKRLPMPVPQVFPVTGGGVDFSWQSDSRELEVEILPDGSARYLAVLTDSAILQESTEEGSLSLDQPEPVRTLAAWLIGD
jgi:hypothetical protein